MRAVINIELHPHSMPLQFMKVMHMQTLINSYTGCWLHRARYTGTAQNFKPNQMRTDGI